VNLPLDVGWALLAQQEGGQTATGGGWMTMALVWIPILLVFYLLLIRPQRREQSRRDAMLSALKKNDRVVTAGGIYGGVTNVHREADEVTIKVDEATNTKIRVTLAAIVRVLGDEPATGSQSSS